MHPRAGAEGIPAQHGVVDGNGEGAQFRHPRGQGGEIREVALPSVHEGEVHHELVHGDIAGALADAQDGAVELIGARLEGGDGIGDAQAPVVVAVPVDPDGLALDDLFLHEPDQVPDAHGGGMAAGVRKADGVRALVDGRQVDGLEVLRARPGGVLGDHHHGHVVGAAEAHRLAREADQVGQVPALGAHADGAGAQEGAGFQRDAHLLLDLRQGHQIRFHRPDGGVGNDGQPMVPDLDHQGLHRGHGVGAGAGHAQIHGVDAQPGQTMQQIPLRRDLGIPHGGTLETVPEGLIEQQRLADPRGDSSSVRFQSWISSEIGMGPRVSGSAQRRSVTSVRTGRSRSRKSRSPLS